MDSKGLHLDDNATDTSSYKFVHPWDPKAIIKVVALVDWNVGSLDQFENIKDDFRTKEQGLLGRR
jgi:hypothetical protein